MRVAVIGNSHTVALRNAWRAWSATDKPAFSFSFFAGQIGDLRRLKLLDGALCPDSIKSRRALGRFCGGDGRIDPKDYDGYAIVGAHLHFSRFLTLSIRHNTLQQRRLYPLESYRHMGLISEACCADRLDNICGPTGLAMTLGRLLRGMSNGPIIIVPGPCPPMRAFPDQADQINAFAAALYRDFVKNCEKTAAEISVTFLPQNPQTLASAGISAEAYVSEREGDDVHMNEAFGRIALADSIRIFVGPGRG
jgi:hypothetical protein